ncbi:hypothetical protein VB620_15405 [Nodularia harveyana UHCC-0300]|uniref:Uncharacterized protein n=1 Tax=Nodularia harveyana UHCC-0300 TaxID=2974287 RepID=A0ABU5UGW4_9CYAN|nr:hypothetical protein [Nodularia harveyana]MEA5582724.1 hypothetical protein [Nodularia harveyana UHCC-0300]
MQSSLNILTVAEYLEAEKTSDIRHECIAGQVFINYGITNHRDAEDTEESGFGRVFA